MDDSIEADLLAARHLAFGADEPAWTDRYVTSLSRLEPSLAPAPRHAAWAARLGAPAAVAYLEHESGRSPQADGRSSASDARRRARQRMLPVWPSE